MRKDYLFVGLQFALFGLYVTDFIKIDVNTPQWFSWVALAVAILGAAIVLLAIAQLSRNLSPFPTPKKGAALVEHGLYHWVRHPIYTGIILVTFGYGLGMGSVWKLVIAAALLLLFHLKSRYEEQLLEERFPGYGGYQSRTGRFFPRFRG